MANRLPEGGPGHSTRTGTVEKTDDARAGCETRKVILVPDDAKDELVLVYHVVCLQNVTTCVFQSLCIDICLHGGLKVWNHLRSID